MRIKRLLVCGDRNFTDLKAIREVIEEIQPEVVIHGACRGADLLAKKVAVELGIIEWSYPADWSQFGKAAGPIRNTQMLRDGKPDLVIAFHDDLENSKGTKDMVKQAKKAGVPTRIERSKEVV